MKIVQPMVELVKITPNAQQHIEAVARTCYRSEDKATEDSAGGFIQRLIASGHESPLEFAFATFRIRCDRGVSHELVRHRLASYAQESTRYCDYANKDIEFILPKVIENQVAVEEFLRDCETLYKVLRKGRNIPPQLARVVLPMCLATTIMMGANLREWRHFLKLRCSTKAHPQMRTVAKQIGLTFLTVVPDVFRDLGELIVKA